MYQYYENGPKTEGANCTFATVNFEPWYPPLKDKRHTL